MKSCYDCEYCSLRFDNTLDAKVYCKKYKKYIPISALVQTFFCGD